MAGFSARPATRAARHRSPSDAGERFRDLAPESLRFSEDNMRVPLLVITLGLLIATPSSAFTQGASIQVEQPWSRATPTGASTGAVYLTITNKSHDTDRLLGASSDVANKSQIHEMKVVNGTMKM